MPNTLKALNTLNPTQKPYFLSTDVIFSFISHVHIACLVLVLVLVPICCRPELPPFSFKPDLINGPGSVQDQCRPGLRRFKPDEVQAHLA